MVIDPAVTPLQKLRGARCHDVYEQLFVLMTLGDERNISETWVNGQQVWLNRCPALHSGRAADST